MTKKCLYLVIPCYNEEEVIEETVNRLNLKINSLINSDKIEYTSRILIVDDGSEDNTWNKIEEMSKNNCLLVGVKLSKNKGHQNALLGGLMVAKDKCDFAISLDADLQDDIDAIDKMIINFYNGDEIVYGVRSSRKKDSFFKRTTAQTFYKFLKFLGVDIIYNHADYRLMSKLSLEALSEFDEVNLFLRGIIPLIGFKTSIVEYERGERYAGKSKYPFIKMLSFAYDGITSFSIRPIRCVMGLGIFIFICSIFALLYALCRKIMGQTGSGWTSIISSIWLLGGLQLFSIGLIGEYIGKIYYETKKRPKYFIEKIIEQEL